MERIKQIMLNNITVVLLVVLCIASGIGVRGFFSPRNLVNLLSQMSILALVSMGMIYSVILKGADLSVGAVGALTGVLASYAGLWLMARMEESMPTLLVVPVLLIVAAVTGIAMGYITGTLIVTVQTAPVICTLAVMYVVRGLAYALSGGQPIYVHSEAFAFLGTGKLIRVPGMSTGVLPFILILAIVCAFAHHWILEKTVLGRNLHSVGLNREAAASAGLDVRKTMRIGYLLCSVMAALGGVANASRYQNGHPGALDGFEMFALPAVVLGGVSLNGGKGSVWKAMLGVAVIAVLRNMMDLLLLSSYWQKFVMGVVLIFAIWLDAGRPLKNVQVR